MKHERLLTLFTGAVLAFLTAWGAAGCFLSAFALPVQNPEPLIAAWVSAALLSASLLAFHHGGKVLLCLSALAAGYLWQDRSVFQQLWQLLHQLSTVYNRAYGLGVLVLPEALEGPACYDWPIGVWGVLIIMAVCRCICRQKSVWFPLLVTLLPLCSCIVVTDTVPGEGWLLMLMACLCTLLLTTSVRQENNAQSLQLTVISAPLVTLALIGLFLAFPQNSYVNQAETFRENILAVVQNFPQFVEQGTRSLVSRLEGRPQKQIDLAHLGARIPFTYPVMEVTAEQSGTLYLRQQDFDQYDGLGWTSSPDRLEPFSQATGAAQVISILSMGRSAMKFLPYYPEGAVSLRDGCLDNAAQETAYTIVQRQLPDNWRQTAYKAAGRSPGAWQQYCSLPDAARQGAVEFLGDLWSQDASNSEKADIIAALVTNAAQYDLEPSLMPEGEPDFALWFLREGDQGYCVHFATAATVLLRSAGVPARYVTGYMLEAKANQAVTVTEENAHAWAEYYEPNLDLWIPLEATPAAQSQEPPPAPVDTTPTAPQHTEPTIPSSLPPDTQNTEAPSPAEPQMPTGPAQMPPQSGQTVLFPLLLIPLFGFVLAIQRSVRLKWYRRRQRTGSVNQQALHRWQEAVRLSRLLKDSPTEELISLAQKAKFSQHELTQEELQSFDSFNRSCLRRLKEKPWYLRLIHQYLYAAY